MYRDFLLVSICLLLFVLTIAAYFIARNYIFEYGVHLMLLSYFFCFFYAAFTHLVSHPLILVYPIILGLSIIYSRNKWVRFIYSFLCFASCAITIYLQHIYFGSTHFGSEILPSILICIGLMFAFPVIIITNSNMLHLYKNQLEEKRLHLKQNNEELNSYIDSNLQLENFAHLASHELKTPLNNVTNFTALLKKKTQNKLGLKETEIMDIIISEVGKMNGLISDLLQFSLVKNADLKYTEFDINTFINRLLTKNFKESLQLIKTEINIQTVSGHEDLLAQLFINLIENAIKFSRNSTNRNIEIKGYESTDFYNFSISDNGIGIKSEYKEHVFLIFKKLHHHSEYTGTGIGLSICKSIVERHGGSIWIKDKPTGGSIFEFNLSKNSATTRFN